MIAIEMIKNEESNSAINVTETEDQKKRRISNIAFSQLLPYSNNMLEFGLKPEDVYILVKRLSRKYCIEEPLVEAIVDNIKNSEFGNYKDIKFDEIKVVYDEVTIPEEEAKKANKREEEANAEEKKEEAKVEEKKEETPSSEEKKEETPSSEEKKDEKTEEKRE